MHQLPPGHDIPRRTSINPKWMIVASAIYLALPFDIVPILGMVGDLTAFVVALNAVRSGLPPRQA